ncbi:hypothetical protein [Fictibacillus barbaricus]|uniref:Uncharacterized protein n=1 Tax=Fictibacillus barbaricus TaxID=182136 RepID=A0ABS2ZHG0_9BACL|nr:hypothetical protein [Fictibacillus barbaricus]MBN3546827.1 hypothetical protein [Fictibacillus barbaricus]GGB44116.1 hypothetical protein GCM10007199_06860 [Fictibacillus barbaricus]
MDLEKVKEYLEIGHDIEPEFHGEKYSITPIPTIPNGVCLTKFYSEEYQEYENPKDLIENATITNQKFKKILNKITNIYLLKNVYKFKAYSTNGCISSRRRSALFIEVKDKALFLPQIE